MHRLTFLLLLGAYAFAMPQMHSFGHRDIIDWVVDLREQHPLGILCARLTVRPYQHADKVLAQTPLASSLEEYQVGNRYRFRLSVQNMPPELHGTQSLEFICRDVEGADKILAESAPFMFSRRRPYTKPKSAHQPASGNIQDISPDELYAPYRWQCPLTTQFPRRPIRVSNGIRDANEFIRYARSSPASHLRSTNGELLDSVSIDRRAYAHARLGPNVLQRPTSSAMADGPEGNLETAALFDVELGALEQIWVLEDIEDMAQNPSSVTARMDAPVVVATQGPGFGDRIREITSSPQFSIWAVGTINLLRLHRFGMHTVDHWVEQSMELRSIAVRYIRMFLLPRLPVPLIAYRLSSEVAASVNGLRNQLISLTYRIWKSDLIESALSLVLKVATVLSCARHPSSVPLVHEMDNQPDPESESYDRSLASIEDAISRTAWPNDVVT